MQRNKYENVAVQIGSVGYLSEPAGHLKRCSFFAQIFDSSFTSLLILLVKLHGRSNFMRLDNDNVLIVPICSTLNTLFVKGGLKLS